MLLTPVTGRFWDGVGVGHLFIYFDQYIYMYMYNIYVHKGEHSQWLVKREETMNHLVWLTNDGCCNANHSQALLRVSANHFCTCTRILSHTHTQRERERERERERCTFFMLSWTINLCKLFFKTKIHTCSCAIIYTSIKCWGQLRSPVNQQGQKWELCKHLLTLMSFHPCAQ